MSPSPPRIRSAIATWLSGFALVTLLVVGCASSEPPRSGPADSAADATPADSASALDGPNAADRSVEAESSPADPDSCNLPGGALGSPEANRNIPRECCEKIPAAFVSCPPSWAGLPGTSCEREPAVCGEMVFTCPNRVGSWVVGGTYCVYDARGTLVYWSHCEDSSVGTWCPRCVSGGHKQTGSAMPPVCASDAGADAR